MEILIGAAVSIITQLVKKYSPNEWSTMSIALGLSLVSAGIYTYLYSTGYWNTALPILGTAGAFYAFVIQRFESKG